MDPPPPPPVSPAVTAPEGHATALRSAGTSAASVSLPETSLTLRCGPEGLATFVCLPPVTCGDSPGGACGFATLRRHLRCVGFPAGNLADAPVRP